MTERTVSVRGDFIFKSSVFARGTTPVVVVEQWTAAGDTPGKPVTTLRTCHVPKHNY